jgi:hypothetical protein
MSHKMERCTAVAGKEGLKLDYECRWPITRKQGDRIGRIFVYWAIIYFCQFFWYSKVAQRFLATFFLGKCNVCFFAKHGLGYILGDFLKNPSGQEAARKDKQVCNEMTAGYDCKICQNSALSFTLKITYVHTRGRCYGFKNIFDKKMTEK